MSEQGMVKVYELAKELGIDSISLLDKLKGLNISVKNHMSELKEDEAQKARTSLKKPRSSSSKKASTSGAPKATRTRKKVAETALAPSLAPSGAEAASEKKSTSHVIRRRVKSEGGVETVQTQQVQVPSHLSGTLTETEAGNVLSSAVTSEDHLSPEASTPSEELAASHAVHQEEDTITAALTSETRQDNEEQAVQSAPTSKGEPEGEEAAPLVDPVELPDEAAGLSPAEAEQENEDALSSNLQETAISPPSINEAQSVTQSQTPTASTLTSSSASGTSESLSTVGKAPARKPIVLTPRPVAPRRSILKIVEAAAPPPRPIIKPAATTAAAGAAKAPMRGTTTNQDKDGYRIIKMTKENLDQMVEEEAAKKRGPREVELRPEDVRFADYRKKELVFLPKRKKIPVGKEIRKTQKTVAKAQKRIVQMHENISVQDLASQLSVKAADVIRKLMGMGQMATINQSIDYDTATLIAQEYQYEVRSIAFNEMELLSPQATDEEKDLQPRPPIVTIMGHVDHGKTTLLDSIREANVAGGEAGGITQHIGAYTVEKNGKLISFIDTPGHEAFTVMRARGANITDIVILVVSADDGVMPQTREALSHAQAARVPIIVAVNKIDKPGANPEKIKQELAELNVLSEDWGGETMFVQVSALKKTNLDKLLDAILLQTEMLDLKANPSARASGVVLEARLQKGRGVVASLLVTRGTLSTGEPVVSGSFPGKIKAMTNDQGQPTNHVTPGIAVEVLGFEGLPNAGDTFHVTQSEIDARKIAQNRIDKVRSNATANSGAKVTLEQLFSKIQTGDMKELNVILKADAFGSVEAVRDSLIKLSTEKVKVKAILAAAGGITESDVLLASASHAIIIGFNVRPETKARQVAESEHVEIKTYSIIYELLDDVKKAMAGLLDKKKLEKFLGRAEVRQTFTVPKIGMIAGCAVIDGKIIRGANLRLLRDSRIVYEGKMSSLRRFKDDAKEVATGFECGIGIENYTDLKAGDIIEAYQIEWIAQELDS